MAVQFGGKFGAVALIVIVAMGAWLEPVDAAVTCQEVVNALMPCAAFLVGNAPSPAPACCPAVQALNSRVNVRADRQATCACFKQAAQTYNVHLDKAQTLPRVCNVALNVAVSPNVNCANVQ